MENIMKEAHRMTREIRVKYEDVDYSAQLGLCMSYLFEIKKEEIDVAYVEIKLTKKELEERRVAYRREQDELEERSRRNKVEFRRQEKEERKMEQEAQDRKIKEKEDDIKNEICGLNDEILKFVDEAEKAGEVVGYMRVAVGAADTDKVVKLFGNMATVENETRQNLRLKIEYWAEGIGRLTLERVSEDLKDKLYAALKDNYKRGRD